MSIPDFFRSTTQRLLARSVPPRGRASEGRDPGAAQARGRATHRRPRQPRSSLLKRLWGIVLWGLHVSQLELIERQFSSPGFSNGSPGLKVTLERTTPTLDIWWTPVRPNASWNQWQRMCQPGWSWTRPTAAICFASIATGARVRGATSIRSRFSNGRSITPNALASAR